MRVAIPVDAVEIVAATERDRHLHAQVGQVPDLARVIEADVVADNEQHARGLQRVERRTADIDAGRSGRAPSRRERVHRDAVLGRDDRHKLVDLVSRHFLAIKGHDNAAGAKLARPRRSQCRERLRCCAYEDVFLEHAP